VRDGSDWNSGLALVRIRTLDYLDNSRNGSCPRCRRSVLDSRCLSLRLIHSAQRLRNRRAYGPCFWLASIRSTSIWATSPKHLLERLAQASDAGGLPLLLEVLVMRSAASFNHTSSYSSRRLRTLRSLRSSTLPLLPAPSRGAGQPSECSDCLAIGAVRSFW